jgi:hypothetical protein
VTSFQTHYFSENMVAQGIEPGPLDLYPGNLTTRPQKRASGSIDINFLDFGTNWKRVVKFRPPGPICPLGKSPRYPLDSRLFPRTGTDDMQKWQFYMWVLHPVAYIDSIV